MIAKNIVNFIRSNNFKRNSEQFLRVNRIAYINARLWEDYSQKAGDKMMEELAGDALREMTVHIDKSIHVLAAIEQEAKSMGRKSRTAMTGTAAQGKISDALKHYVKVEKDWLRLNDLADSIERVGVSGQEDEIRSDMNKLFSDIADNAKTAIDILVNLRTMALDEMGA